MAEKVTGGTLPLQPITEQLQQITATLQAYTDERKKQCVCGHIADTTRDLNIHREGCQLLKMAAVGDIIRVANLLGRTPTHREYNTRRSPSIPSWSLLAITIFDTWSGALAECRLPPVRDRTQTRNINRSFNPAIRQRV
jgi:hypothetical protein